MNLRPTLQVKKLEECELTELVRPLNWEGDNIGFVSQPADGAGRILIMLRTDGKTDPAYIHIQDIARPVLSYGQDYTFEIDHRESVDLAHNELWRQNGALFLTGLTWTMRVHSGDGMRSGALHYNLESGGICGEPTSPEVAIFGKWQLYIDSELAITERAAPVLKFPSVDSATEE